MPGLIVPGSAGAAGVEAIAAGLLLDAWERAAEVPESRRAAELVSSLGLLQDADRASLAECDRAMLELQQMIFGNSAELILDCARCGVSLEVDLELEPLTRRPDPVESVCVATSVGTVVVRAVRTEDLVAAGAALDPVTAFLERLVSCPDGLTVASLSVADQELIDEAAEELAGVAGYVLAARCPSCGDQNIAAVDPAAWGWERLDLWAARQLEEVAALARAYGWTEPEVLALSPARRTRYLELADR